MCFTLSRTVTTGRWNWDGDTIVHEPVIRGARRTPNRNRLYDLDIREFLNTKSNEVVARGVGDAIDHLRPSEQALFRSHRRGSFDFRVQIMSEYLARHFPYVPGPRGFDFWLFPDETIAEGGGDCEDRAILLAALLLASGVSGYVVRVAIGVLYDAEADDYRDHVWVMYRNENGKWMCLEPLLLTNQARRTARSRVAERTIPQGHPYEYIPYFVFNDAHLWAIKQNTGDPARQPDGLLADYLHARRFWEHFDPAFATGVHSDIFDYALADMSDADRFYVKACSLALDSISSYDPREHFDNGYIDEGWSLLREYLAEGSLNTLTYALHAVADFYAHTSYAHFAPQNNGALELYNDAVPSPFHPRYDAEVFNLHDTNRFTVNEHFYTQPDRNAAVAYCTRRGIISGRFAQTRDPHQGFLEKNLVHIPYEMRNAADFPSRGALPHHNEIAVDGPLGSDRVLPDGHRLYQTPEDYEAQFNLRFHAARQHVANEYAAWTTHHGR
jgi:hypothetical protein